MKKNILVSYIHGIRDTFHGESYSAILSYFLPEFVTTVLLYSCIPLLDSWWIADLKSTSIYATLGATNIFIHFIIKIAEGFSVGTVILTGTYNGQKAFDQVGRTLINVFWVTCIVGGVVAGTLYFGAYWIYRLYGIPAKMIAIGVPFLKLRAISVFLMFIYFAFVGFLRGIKNTRVPMQIFTVGSIIFLFFDYALIFGKYGFPQMKLQGSALASIIQYSSMMFMAFCYIIFVKENRKYGINLINVWFDWSHVKDILRLSWPVMVDKAILAAAGIWVGMLVNPMGKYVIASFTVIKDLQRLAIQPGVAFSQVITFLVSNSYGAQDWDGIKNNIKKVVFLSSLSVFVISFIFSVWPHYFIQFFDHKGKFTYFSAQVLPILSVMIFFDLLQLLLSGALRGATDVKVVMWVRVAVLIFFFFPVSWFFAHLPLENIMLKFVLVYGTLYISNGLMSAVYINRFRGERWKTKSIGTR